MGGRPQRRAMLAELERRTREYFETPEGEAPAESILDYVCARVADGCSLRELAEAVALDVGFAIPRERLVTLLEHVFGADVEHKLTLARTRGASALVDEALVIVDEVQDSNEELTRARNRANQRNWMAERADRKAFGRQPDGANVTISFGDLHLQALQSLPIPQALPHGETVEAEGVTVETVQETTH